MSKNPQRYRLAWHDSKQGPWVRTRPQTRSEVLAAVKRLLTKKPVTGDHAVEISIQRLNPGATSTADVMPSTTSFRKHDHL